MGWETRERGGGYYVQKQRRGKKVVSQYIGTGDHAALFARSDAILRQEERELRQLRAERSERLRAEDRVVDDYCRMVENIFRQAMQASGYHRPKRGQWRKQRMAKTLNPETGLDPEKQHIFELIRKGEQGDREAAKEAVALIEKRGTTPHMVAMFTGFSALLEIRYEKNPMRIEAYKIKMNEMQKELGYDASPPLERLLIDRIVICWQDVNDRELLCAMCENLKKSIDVHEEYGRMLTSAQKRYLAAIQALAQVRRLKLPALEVHGGQVNIGEKQVNVVQCGTQVTPPPLRTERRNERNELYELTL